MSRGKSNCGVLVVGPGLECQGGIAKVLENYQKTSFWGDYKCCHFSSTNDGRSKLAKALHDVVRFVRFVALLTFSAKPRVVSIHTSHSASFYRKLAYIIASRLYGIPVVLHIHPAAFTAFYQSGGALQKRAIKLAGNLCDKIICLSKDTKSDVVKMFPAAVVDILGNPVDVEFYAKNDSTRERLQPRVLFMGWIVREKGVYDLLEAIPGVAAMFPDVTFTFAGNKEVEKLRHLVEQRGLGSSVDVVGWVEGKVKMDLLWSSTVFVLPSYSEGLPNVILEAMASRLPIVTTPVGGIPNVLMHDVTAIFVNPGEPESIRDGINALLANPAKRALLAETAFELVTSRYSLDTISDSLAQIYDRYFPEKGRSHSQLDAPYS